MEFEQDQSERENDTLVAILKWRREPIGDIHTNKIKTLLGRKFFFF